MLAAERAFEEGQRVAKAVLSVGQCGFDDSRIARVMAEELGAVMDRVASTTEARQMIAEKKYDLILVNRVFDATGESGVGFIGEISGEANAPHIMLVSNYEEAQKEAVGKGALPGFGKSQLQDPAATNQLRATLAVIAVNPPRTS
jgi:hypothetical protein